MLYLLTPPYKNINKIHIVITTKEFGFIEGYFAVSPALDKSIMNLFVIFSSNMVLGGGRLGGFMFAFIGFPLIFGIAKGCGTSWNSSINTGSSKKFYYS